VSNLYLLLQSLIRRHVLPKRRYQLPKLHSIKTPKTTFWVQSNLGSRTPRIMNISVYEQIFRTQSVSDDYCLELRTRKPSTSWSDKLGVSASAVFVEEWSSGKYPESATPIGESVSCCVAFVHSNSLRLLLNFSVFCVFLYKLLNRTP